MTILDDGTAYKGARLDCYRCGNHECMEKDVDGVWFCTICRHTYRPTRSVPTQRQAPVGVSRCETCGAEIEIDFDTGMDKCRCGMRKT
jgi:hypothetical protein